MSELEKMLKGMIYDPSDEELLKRRTLAHRLSNMYNQILDDDDPKRKEIIDQLIPDNNGVYLQGPIRFDYGYNTHFGTGCYANFNLTVLDICPINIGDNVFIGPNVSIVNPVHPYLPEERKLYQREDGVWTDKEYGKPINIGSNCWIASCVTVCGGVNIGEGCIIGSGSVVTRDIPPYTLAAGNPCKIIRKITKEDSIYLKKNLF